MLANMGAPDRIIRVIIGVIAAALPLAGVVTGAWMWIAYLVAAVFILTSSVGFCPLYRVFGWSTKTKGAAAPGAA
jgi:hypothetical protein